VQQATSQAKLTFAAEKSAISSSVEHASRVLQTEAFRAQSEDHRRLYDEAYAELSKLLRDDGEGAFSMQVARITPPPIDPRPEIDEAIQRAHRNLMEERSKYFDEVRRKLNGDPRVAELVKARLHEIGCPECWQAIS
jgi:hypothetical protein